MSLLTPLTANTILYCREWHATVAFYRDRLRLPVTFDSDWFVEFVVAPDARLSIADERRASIKSSGGAGITLTFQVEDARAVWDLFQAAGLAPGPLKQHAWGALVFYLRDPEGHRLEVWSPAT
jgi:catechol 2,3-dioxygenase-like lactoylglutathione lyase family enzyme